MTDYEILLKLSSRILKFYFPARNFIFETISSNYRISTRFEFHHHSITIYVYIYGKKRSSKNIVSVALLYRI